MPHIVCITSSYPRHEDDIAGCFVKRWKESLEVHGHDVKILTWQVDKKPSCASCMMVSGVSEIRYAPHAWQVLFHGAGAPENIAANPWRVFLVPGAMASMGVASVCVVVKTRPVLLVGHWLVPGGFLVRLVGHLMGVPSLIVTHSGGIAALSHLPSWLSGPLARYLASGPLTFVSEDARLRFVGLLDGVHVRARVMRMPVLPMGFDPPDVSSGRSRDGVLMLGRAVDIKGGDDVIRAYAQSRVCREHKAPLHVIGDGPCLQGWVELAHRLGVDIRAHGQLVGTARDEVIARCGVALFGSKRLESGREEGLPVALLECASVGVLPLIAHVPAARGFLADVALQVFDASRDESLWSGQIDRLYERRDDDELCEAQVRSVEGLSWDVLGERWRAYVNSIQS